MSEGTQRRLAAILAADVVGYSRLMEADEAGTLATMKAHRQELWTPKIEEHCGRVVGTAGDSIVVEFGSAVGAVECAVAVQQGMAELDAGLPDDQRMLLRIGINIGEVVVDGEEIYGDGVNIAARLEALADPGGICVSDDLYRQVAGKNQSKELEAASGLQALVERAAGRGCQICVDCISSPVKVAQRLLARYRGQLSVHAIGVSSNPRNMTQTGRGARWVNASTMGQSGTLPRSHCAAISLNTPSSFLRSAILWPISAA